MNDKVLVCVSDPNGKFSFCAFIMNDKVLVSVSDPKGKFSFCAFIMNDKVLVSVKQMLHMLSSPPRLPGEPLTAAKNCDCNYRPVTTA